MKWFALWPVRITSTGEWAWLRWVWRERNDISVPFTPMEEIIYKEIDEYLKDELLRLMGIQFPINLSMKKEVQDQYMLMRFGFKAGAATMRNLLR